MKFPATIYVAVEKDSDDSEYLVSFKTPEDADDGGHSRVAVYGLVTVKRYERLLKEVKP